MRNNILLTFSDFNQLYEIGIYKEKNNRELIPVEDIDFINLKVKELARNLCSELKANKIKIYNHESESGLLNHIGIRNNEVNNFLLEFYIKYLDQQFLNFLVTKFQKIRTLEVHLYLYMVIFYIILLMDIDLL